VLTVGSDLVPLVPCRAVLYSRPGYGAVAAQSGGYRTRGARRVARSARRGERAVRARNALFTKSYA